MAEGQLGPLGDALLTSAASEPGPVECRLGPVTGWFTGVRVLQLPATGLDGLADAVRAGTVPVVPEQAQGEPPFNGHLTLARAKGRLGAAAQAELAGIPFAAAFLVQHVDVVASKPSPSGHVYSTVVRARLGSSCSSTVGSTVSSQGMISPSVYETFYNERSYRRIMPMILL